MKTAITLIPEITELVEIDNKRQTSEPLLSVFVRNFLATLLVVPDNPDLGVVYLFGGLLNALKKYHWQPASLAKVEVFTDAVCYLTASCQEEYIYSVHNGVSLWCGGVWCGVVAWCGGDVWWCVVWCGGVWCGVVWWYYLRPVYVQK